MAKQVTNKATEETQTAQVIERTSAGLREAIFDEIDAIRAGTSNPTRANAVAKLAMAVVETVHMEVEVQKHLLAHPQSRIGEKPAILNGSLGIPLALGK